MADDILVYHLTLRNFTGGVLETITVYSRAQLARAMADWSETFQPGDTITVDPDSETT